MSWKKRQKGNKKIIDRVVDDICQKSSYRSWLIDLEMDRPLSDRSGDRDEIASITACENFRKR